MMHSGSLAQGRAVLLMMLVILISTSCTQQKPPPLTLDQATVDYNLLLTLPAEPLSFDQTVRPVLEQRCVVCHGCYDAPCQLKLSSWEGLARGANKQKVYDGERIKAAEPTRLFIDAHTPAEWRTKGFHTVLNEGKQDPESNLQNSVMYRMLRLKQLHPQPRAGMLPDSFDLGLDRKQVCATRDEFGDYARQHPLWGMPYAMPNLENDEYRILVQWLAQGAPHPGPAAPSAAAQPQIKRWETFLNEASLKRQLVSRYIYEHLFIGHLHFDGTSDREFYRLLRSRTPPGQPIDEIATLRPYNDPGPGPFYYRIQRYPSSIVAKTHVVYALSDARLARYRELFLEPDYVVAALPGYAPELAANPFKVFEPIPPASRYRFLLDDAHYFIEGFIKGPVCRGQVALNVIEDHFWVMFFDPDKALFTQTPAFLDNMAGYLQLPEDGGKGTLAQIRSWGDFWKEQQRYMNAKQSAFEAMRQYDLKEAMEFIWNGDNENPNATLTVFRNFDSASVTFGLIGDYPETAWVIDFPMLERIHYLLVAGFNVYGNVGHQLTTRLYMDFLRMEGEDYFLAFLPVSHRKRIRDSWYAGLRSDRGKMLRAPSDWLNVESVRGYKTANPQQELYTHLEQRLEKVARLDHDLDRCDTEACTDKDATAAKIRVNRAMRRVAGMGGLQLRVFPDVSFVRVRTGEAEDDLAYTLIRNKAYKNVTSILTNVKHRDLADEAFDTLTVVDWLEGSYPNIFFVVDLEDIEAFAERYLSVHDRDDYEQFVALYGMRRTNTGFWETADWFNAQYAREQPLLAGLFDLNRYRNR
jgi:ribosomal protein L16/L10AE